ncbi:MAG: hypothetical protein WCK39_03540 [Methanomassiliicoccales archaeon]
MDPTVCKVTEARAKVACTEVHKVFPEAECKVEYDREGRGVIKFIVDRCLVDMEFVETQESWHHPRRLKEYENIIGSKCRVVVLIPEPHALKARLRMLDLNMKYLFYYQVYAYDAEGRTTHISTVHQMGGHDSSRDKVRGYA